MSLKIVLCGSQISLLIELFFKILIAKLPKWFGERPGKRAGDPETPEGEEDAKVGAEEEEIEEEEVEEKHVSFSIILIISLNFNAF